MLEKEISTGLKARIFNIHNGDEFDNLALAIFRYQAQYNLPYKQFLEILNVNPVNIISVGDIPFLPVEFFKNREIITFQKTGSETIFESSGTTGETSSKHYVRDASHYEKIAESIFNRFYGPLHDFVFLALLPSYIERGNSSLVYMVNFFIEQSMAPGAGFFLDNLSELVKNIKQLKKENKKIVLIGVTFALLDMAENFSTDLSDVILMETGGMKGRRKEMIREEVHDILKQNFNLGNVHSEYGMTELLSQAYAKADGIFECPPWMKIKIRDMNDPFCYVEHGKTGGINIIDLGNVDSCAFIETKDIGQYIRPHQFKVLGRFDNADIRGCNLMVAGN